MTQGKIRLLPSLKDVAWLAAQVEAGRVRAAGGRRRPQAGRLVHEDDVGPASRSVGRPRSPGSVASRIAALAVGDWFDCPGRPATVRKNAHALARAAGVRVSVLLVGDDYRVTRIADDSPRGRWPDLAGKDDEKTPV